MRFDEAFVATFNSPAEFAVYVSVFTACEHMIESFGEPIAHTFIYHKKEDLTHYDLSESGCMSFKAMYSRMPVDVLNTMPLYKVPAFDVKKEIVIMIVCLENALVEWSIIPFDKLMITAGAYSEAK